MKIVIIGPAHPFRGGIAMFNERLAKAFQDNQHEVSIVTFTLQYPSILFPGKTQYSNEQKPTHLSILPLINSINPFNWFSVGSTLKKQFPDLVIFSYWMPFMAPCFGTIAKILKKNKKTKVIGLVHNAIPHDKKIGVNFMTNYFTKQSDGFIALSESVKKDLESFTSKPIFVTHHPLYDTFGKKIPKHEAQQLLNLNQTTNYLLFFGIIRNYKGLDLLLEALTDERIRNNAVHLIIAGEFYEDKTPYQKIIDKNQLSSTITIIDTFIPNDKVAQYFCASDLVVLPYRSATQSGVTQIAFHFDKPMLVTNVGGLKEIVKNSVAGYVVDPNPKSIANAIVDFYQSNRELEFTKGVEQEKQHYSWDKLTEKFISLFQLIQTEQ